MRGHKRPCKTSPEDIEMVSVNSAQFNIDQSVLTAALKTLVGQNSMTIPYKIDMGSDSNIMPIDIFETLFPGVTNEQLAATVNKCIMLKMYNKTTITQLRTCKVRKIRKHVNFL